MAEDVHKRAREIAAAVEKRMATKTISTAINSISQRPTLQQLDTELWKKRTRGAQPPKTNASPRVVFRSFKRERGNSVLLGEDGMMRICFSSFSGICKIASFNSIMND